MKVVCRHGHFAFYPFGPSDIGRFNSYFSQTLEMENDYYTFPFLKGAPRTSLQTKPWLGLPAIKNYEGRNAWDVMKENGFVYSIDKKIVVPKASIFVTADIPRASFYYLASTALIQPGCRVITGQQVLSYEGNFDLDQKTLKIRELSFE